jgi:hypothetical protein
MKKRIICGSAAVLLTGLTGAMFTTAAPHARDSATVAYHAAGSTGRASATPSRLSQNTKSVTPALQTRG